LKRFAMSLILSTKSLPHDPRIPYFRAGEKDMGDRRKLFNFVLPIYPTKWLTLRAALVPHSLLLDGHHKLHAAHLSGRPLRLLTFVALSQGVSTKEQVDEVLRLLSDPA
jgi:hypothetical protein